MKKRHLLQESCHYLHSRWQRRGDTDTLSSFSDSVLMNRHDILYWKMSQWEGNSHTVKKRWQECNTRRTLVLCQPQVCLRTEAKGGKKRDAVMSGDARKRNVKQLRTWSRKFKRKEDSISRPSSLFCRVSLHSFNFCSWRFILLQLPLFPCDFTARGEKMWRTCLSSHNSFEKYWRSRLGEGSLGWNSREAVSRCEERP